MAIAIDKNGNIFHQDSYPTMVFASFDGNQFEFLIKIIHFLYFSLIFWHVFYILRRITNFNTTFKNQKSWEIKQMAY